MDLERAAKAIDAFLEALGHSAEGELKGTGKRVAEAYAKELLSGYAMHPAKILQEGCATTEKDLVTLYDIETTLVCPHHLLPSPGVVHLAYRPGSRLFGLGALTDLCQCLGKRFTLQETFTRELVEALETHGDAEAATVVVDLRHSCLSDRGPCQRKTRVRSSASIGTLDDAERAVFFSGIPRPQ